ncbi:hypothetical protein D3C87_1699070 [compost metagenome]
MMLPFWSRMGRLSAISFNWFDLLMKPVKAPSMSIWFAPVPKTFSQTGLTVSLTLGDQVLMFALIVILGVSQYCLPVSVMRMVEAALLLSLYQTFKLVPEALEGLQFPIFT